MATRKKRSRRSASNRLAVAALAGIALSALPAALSVRGSDTVAAQANRPRAAGKAVKSGDGPLLLQVRDALDGDGILAKFNVGVRVRDGVVTLHGPVPAHDVAEQAVTIVRKLHGVNDVRNELYTPAPDEPLARAMPHPVTAQRPSVTADNPPPINIPAPVAIQPVSLSLPEQIDRLRQRDRRFSDIRVEVKDGRVILRGSVARSQDAWEFADQVSRLSGVTGVVMSIGNGR